MKKILVTGGAGFIGRNLISKLIDTNKIICVDNFLTSDYSNIQEFSSSSNFELIESDIINLKNIECDFIYNLACAASPVWYSKYHKETIKTCTEGVFNILNIAKLNNAKLFHASTSEVYGDPNIHPQNERYNGNVNPIGLRSCYDEGKRCSETLFMDYYREHGLKIKIIRIFNTYGPNMAINDGRVISNFINQAINNENITVYGDGTQTRCFQYISDLVDGMIKFMNSSDIFRGPLNMGNTNEISMNDLAKKVIKLTNSNSNLIYQDLPIDDPKTRKPNISLALSELNWSPGYDLDTGLKNTIKYFRIISNKSD